MAEAAGLAVGTIALASLFQTCLDFLEYIEDARNTKGDQDRGETKLGLLKIRLRQWGDDLQVSHPGHEDGGLRKHWPEEGGTISKSLIGIAAILDEAANLNRKYESYNMKESPSSSPDLELDKGSGETQVLRRKYCKYLIIFKQRASWALKDKKKLHSLLTELDFFITNLEKVTVKLLQTGSFEYYQSPTYESDSDMSRQNSHHTSYPPSMTRDYGSDMSSRSSKSSAHHNTPSQWPSSDQQRGNFQALVQHGQASGQSRMTSSQALVRLPGSTSSGHRNSQGAPSHNRTYQSGTDKDGNTYNHCVADIEAKQFNGNVDSDSRSGRHTYNENEAKGKAKQVNGNSSYQFAMDFFK
ncbi:hypothetical protein PFICI_06374 [Pestalotiopsis fici W106-1]|uniref:Prion-inhibition and propagation HeLo domain-containing protein n=1 Tax=Pestalotiopsis fici (strain W106-1 / CGMCC3.15140) TaxID=1229662 RepID=W3X7L0_PESFW|nr:uncharacterized protein PFICI_06374 [Pestalotiopsis fici W106-1]ETS81372.1 hypothetical protein PFICI_06374 [Pestalotiopsis fici W106-1]